MSDADYICPQCGPDPRGAEAHAAAMHTFAGLYPTGPDRAWLIEYGIGPTYLSVHMGWCDNPHHARRFPTYAEARKHADSLKTGPYAVKEHMWVDPPTPASLGELTP